MRFVAATRNPAKVREIERLFSGMASVEPLPDDISLEITGDDSSEIGDSCAEIARAKAIASSLAIGEDSNVIATDGGVVIPALGERWRPTRTRRFAGVGANDLQRAEALLHLTTDLRGRDRHIGWTEALVIARGGVILAEWSAASDPGLLALAIDVNTIEQSDGFWIDALWTYPKFGGRFRRELSSQEIGSVVDHWSRLGGMIQRWSGKPHPALK